METVKTRELANALGLSVKSVLEKARTNGWAYVSSGKGLAFVENRLPTDVRFAVAVYRQNSTASENKALAGDAYINASDKAQGTAQYRAALIAEYTKSGVNVGDFLMSYNELMMFPALFNKLGKVTQATFYRWYKAWKEMGASGVVPKYGMSRGGAGESLADEERNLLKHFWLQNTQPSAMHAYRLMKANLPFSTCTYQTALRFLNSIPKATAGYYRKGESRFENLFLPHMEQNIEQYGALQVAVSDHHCLDCVVMYKGQKIRPWLTTFQDLRSGKILGWCPSIKPSSFSIVVAYYMACVRYGVPEMVLFDNGKDYHSKWLNGTTEKVTVLNPEGIEEEEEVEFEGLFSIVGSKVKFTRTYNGKSKARQERYFRIIGEYFAKDIGTYVGSDSRSRPDDAQLLWRAIDGREQRNDIPAWEDFVPACEAMIEYINDNFECSSPCMKGMTRTQVFVDNLPPPDQIRHPSVELLQKALLKGEIRKVSRNGVKVGGINFWHQNLFEFNSRQIRVYKNLTNPDVITCHTLKGDFICEAYANYFRETGRLSEDVERLESARKNLTEIAVLGSGEVQASPEYNSMIEVAQRNYANNAIESVNKFLDYNEAEDDAEPMAAGAENVSANKTVTRKNQLKSPFSGDIK